MMLARYRRGHFIAVKIVIRMRGVGNSLLFSGTYLRDKPSRIYAISKIIEYEPSAKIFLCRSEALAVI